MLDINDLKSWLHKKDFAINDKLLMILSSLEPPAQVKDINQQAKNVGFRIPPKTNISSLLSRTNGLAIRTPEGWELTDSGVGHLIQLGISTLSPASIQVAVDLRKELDGISDATTKSFAEEAIKCHEAGLYRSAIVMSWMTAIDILHKHIHANHLADFNKEAKRINANWRPAKSTDDLGKMKESDFLDRLSTMSVIGKNVKKELKDCLDRRNACGHPNSLKIGPNTVAHHLEILLLNVYQVF